MSVVPRLNRFFGADGECFEAAMDHGVHDQPSFRRGIQDLKRAVDAVAVAKPDAILLSMVQAHLLQSLAGNEKPSLVVRADPTNLSIHPHLSMFSATYSTTRLNRRWLWMQSPSSSACCVYRISRTCTINACKMSAV